MQAPPIGESSALLVRLYVAADGVWRIHVEGSETTEDIPLAPVTLIIRLWRTNDTRVLRGTIQLHGSSHCATIQGNAQLVKLVRAWLLDDGSTGQTGE
jgi:hypothetical protein